MNIAIPLAWVLTVAFLLTSAQLVEAQCSQATISNTTNNEETCPGGNPNFQTMDYKAWSITARTYCSYGGWKNALMGNGAISGTAIGQCGGATQGTRPVCPGYFQGPYDLGSNGQTHYVQLVTTDNSYTGSGCQPGSDFYKTEGAPSEECSGLFCCGSGVEEECGSRDGTWNSGFCECQGSPIIVDVANNGFDLTDGLGGVPFDLWGTGNLYKLAWTKAEGDDAFLALDRNGNGRVDDGSELFGNVTEQPDPIRPAKRNGFAALQMLDANGDGAISAADPMFAQLRIWRDRNHDGKTDSGELRPLVGIIERIELQYRESRRQDAHGNLFRYRAQFKRQSGAMGTMYDVFLLGARSPSTR